MQNRKMLKTPIILVESFLALTFLFYFIGPIKWNTRNENVLVPYVLCLFFAVFVGYVLYFSRKKQSSYGDFALKKDNIVSIVSWLLIINLIVFTLYLIRNLGANSFSFSNLVEWITNPNTQYSLKFGRSYSLLERLIAMIATASSFFLWPTIPLGIYLFRDLKTKDKFLLLLNIVVELVRWFAMGTNKGIIDMILVFLSLFLISLFQKKQKAGKKLLLVIFGIVLVTLGLNYFNSNINGRVNYNYQHLLNNLGGSTIDFDNILLKLFPNQESLIINTHSYFTQGYYGLSLGLGESFTPMFGLGHSGFLRENAEDMFGVDLYQFTYMHKIDRFGWNEFSNWHTAYLWFACDFGFFGTVLVMLVAGYYFAFVCDNLLNGANKLFFPLFVIMIQFFFYSSMNNQIFNMPFSFMGFWGMNFFLVIQRGKRHKEHYFARGR